MKKNDSLLVRATWKVRNVLPEAVDIYCARMWRRVLQLKGAPFSKKRRGVVAMLHIGRCGSTVLANMLVQNPEIYWDGKTARKVHELYGDSVKALDMAAWFKKQFPISGARYYGFEFKILRDQYVNFFDKTMAEFLDIWKSIGVTHFILLYRGNTLNQAISHYSGIHNKVWHISPDSGKQAAEKSFAIDFGHVSSGSGKGLPLTEYLCDIENTKDDIRRILQDQNLLELEYEGDILEAGPQAAYQKICAFLKIPEGEVSVRNKKVLGLPPSEAVENYDDAVRALTGTDFEWMLDQK